MPAIDSSKCRCKSPGSRRARIIEPKPSTVPMRVSDVIVGSRTPSRNRYFDCATFGNDLGPQLERRVEDLGAELLAVRLLPRVDRGHAVLRAGRDVRAVGGEAAVAAHAARDQRLGDVVGREQLLLGPGQLEIGSWAQCKR